MNFVNVSVLLISLSGSAHEVVDEQPSLHDKMTGGRPNICEVRMRTCFPPHVYDAAITLMREDVFRDFQLTCNQYCALGDGTTKECSYDTCVKRCLAMLEGHENCPLNGSP